jgi:ribokinase
VIGSLNTDLVSVTPRVPSGGETLTGTSFSTGAGGKGANQAVACARLSRPNPRSLENAASASNIIVRMIGAVGADSFGSDLVSGMSKDGVDTSGVRVIDGQTTGVAVIIVEEGSGENRILLNPGANHSLQPSDFQDVASFGTPKPDLVILQLEIPLQTVLQVMETAKMAGISVLINPAPAVALPDEVFQGLDHLILNESEAAILSGRNVEEVGADDMDWGILTEEFIKKGVKHVVVTLGAKGAYFATSQGTSGFAVSEKGIKVVDTTAAGDTFVGAYAVEIVRGLENGSSIESSMQKAVQWSCKAAGRTVEKAGAHSAIPWADEVDRK